MSRGRGPGPAASVLSSPRSNVALSSQAKAELAVKWRGVEDEGSGGIDVSGEQAEDDGREVAHCNTQAGRWNQRPRLNRREIGTQRIEATAKSAQKRLGGRVFEGRSTYCPQRRVKAEAAPNQTRKKTAQNGRAVLAARNAGRGQQRDRTPSDSTYQPLDPNPFGSLRIGFDGGPLVVAVPAQPMVIGTEWTAQRIAGEQRPRLAQVPLDSAGARA